MPIKCWIGFTFLSTRKESPMKINLEAAFTSQASYAEMIREVHLADLSQITDELCDELESILVDMPEGIIHFVPADPAASDNREQGWTLGHIVTHLTATLEEAAATAAMFARG